MEQRGTSRSCPSRADREGLSTAWSVSQAPFRTTQHLSMQTTAVGRLYRGGAGQALGVPLVPQSRWVQELSSVLSATWLSRKGLLQERALSPVRIPRFELCVKSVAVVWGTGDARAWAVGGLPREDWRIEAGVARISRPRPGQRSLVRPAAGSGRGGYGVRSESTDERYDASIERLMPANRPDDVPPPDVVDS